MAFSLAQNNTNDSLNAITTVTIVDSTNTDTLPVISTYNFNTDENQPGKPIVGNDELNLMTENDTLLNETLNQTPANKKDSTNTIIPVEIKTIPLSEKNVVTQLDTTEFKINPDLNAIYPPIPPSNNAPNNQIVDESIIQQTNDYLNEKDSLAQPTGISKLGEHAPSFDDPNYEKKKEEWRQKYPEEYNAVNPQSNNIIENQIDENERRHLQLEQILKTDSIQYNIELENLKLFDPDFFNEHLKRINNN